MTREQAIAAITCYSCGDLPPEVLLAIDDLLAEDAELRQLVDQIREQNDRATEVLVVDEVSAELRRALEGSPVVERGARVPALPVSAEVPVAGAAPFLLTLAAIAAAVLVAVGLFWGLGPDASAARDLSMAVATHHQATSGAYAPLSPDDGATLAQRFDAAGVPEPVRVVPDLQHIGLRAVSVYVLPGEPPGVAVIYEGDGVEYLCQMWSELDIPIRGAVHRDVSGYRLHGYERDGVAFVVWIEGDVVCVQSAAVPLAQLLDLVERRVG